MGDRWTTPACGRSPSPRPGGSIASSQERSRDPTWYSRACCESDDAREAMAKPNRRIQITIDDAPGPSNPSMRALLAEAGIKTMFFVEGEFVAKRPADVVAMVKGGHRLGLH